MPRPLIGIGHSFGAAIITHLAYLHPNLFSALVLLDPVISHRAVLLGGAGNPPLRAVQTTLGASSARRDLWPSRADAARALSRNRFYATWDPRALDKLVQYGFRACPTRLYPDHHRGGSGSGGEEEEEEGEVTLTTTKHMECFTYYRQMRQQPGAPPASDAGVYAEAFPDFAWYQAAPPQTALRLGELRPGVLWMTGADSMVCPPETNRERMETTGYGWGGSGGAKAGRVEEFVVAGTGHLLAMEKPAVVAERAAEYLGREVARWRREEEVYRKEWVEGVDDRDKAVMSKEFRDLISRTGPEAAKRRNGSVAGPHSKL